MTAPLTAYVRVSRRGDREDGRFRSPQEQEERARQHAEAQGYAVGEVVSDIDVSGAVHPQDRPGMARVLEEIRLGRSGGIVAYSLDRLSRDPGHGDWLVREVTGAGGVLATPDMPADITSPTGEFQFGILLQVARLYRRTAGERFTAAAEAAVRRGIPHGPVPFGYRQLPDRTIEPDPVTAPLVRAVFERRIRGDGWGAIGTWLSEQTGRSWSRRGVSHLIARDLYRTGRLSLGSVVSERNSGALVEEATWHAAQSPRAVRDGRTHQAKSLLAGLIRCGSCGRVLSHWRPTPSQKGRARRYRCVGLDCKDRVSVHGPAAEDMVVEEAFAVDLRLIARPQETVDLEPLEEALVKAERQYARMQEPEAMDALGDDWAVTARKFREARDEAAQALGEARAEAGIASAGGTVLRLGHIWDDLAPDQQREALRWTFESVRVQKVPRGQPPSLEFIVRASRPFGTLAYRPPDIVPE